MADIAAYHNGIVYTVGSLSVYDTYQADPAARSPENANIAMLPAGTTMSEMLGSWMYVKKYVFAAGHCGVHFAAAPWGEVHFDVNSPASIIWCESHRHQHQHH